MNEDACLCSTVSLFHRAYVPHWTRWNIDMVGHRRSGTETRLNIDTVEYRHDGTMSESPVLNCVFYLHCCLMTCVSPWYDLRD